MFRAALTIYLIVVAGIGPSLCCCTFKWTKPTAAADEPAAPCCCQHEADESTPPSQPPCDCHRTQKQPGMVAEVDQALPSVSFQGEWVVLSAWMPVHACLPTTTSTLTPHLGQSYTEGPARAPHVLRC